MSDGRWSGGRANRTWSRGTSVIGWPGDEARSERLFEELAGEIFWCETCGRTHPLDEHTLCRRAESAAIIAGRKLRADSAQTGRHPRIPQVGFWYQHGPAGKPPPGLSNRPVLTLSTGHRETPDV